MPELPEVEAARHLVDHLLVGSVVTKVISIETGGGPREGQYDDLIIQHTEEEFAAALLHRPLLAAKRKGKQLWLEMGKASSKDTKKKSSGSSELGSVDCCVLIHLGMTGSLVVQGHPAPGYKSFKVQDKEWPPRFCKFELCFANGERLAFCDPRRIGRVRIIKSAEAEKEEPLSKLAPDPFLDQIDVKGFTNSISKIKTNIKSVLLDQERLLSGVGNWIADEVLYQAKIHPSSICSALDEKQVQTLAATIMSVVKIAVKCTTSKTEFPSDWLFHYRWGKAGEKHTSKDAHGKSIVFETVGGRTSAIVPSVQKLQKAPSKKPIVAVKEESKYFKAKAEIDDKRDDSKKVKAKAAQTAPKKRKIKVEEMVEEEEKMSTKVKRQKKDRN